LRLAHRNSHTSSKRDFSVRPLRLRVSVSNFRFLCPLRDLPPRPPPRPPSASSLRALPTRAAASARSARR
jgi:hypothetical protein